MCDPILAAEGTKQDSNIVIALRVAETDEITRLFRGGSGSYSKGLYLLGEVINNYSTSASVRLKVWSSNNPAFPVNEITVGWVPPNGHIPVYFMRSLSQPPLKTSIEEIVLEYEILSVNRK
jgi:hypothetical protein